MLGFSHWQAKIGWLCGTRQMQKNVSLRSEQVKTFASAKTKSKSVHGLETMRCKVAVAEFTAWMS
jgi:hypothetical protein